LTPKQLQTFLTISNLGSFAAAAERLNATPSTISARIQELEQELGVSLFDRSYRRLHLTTKGRELLSYAGEVVELIAEIKLRVGSPEVLSGLVRIGVAEMVAVSWLPRLAAAIRARYPSLMLAFDVALTAELLSKLRTGDLDLALIPGSHFEPGFSHRALGSVRFAWMAGGSHEVPDGVIGPSELRQWRILSLGESSFHHDTVRQWTEAAGKVRASVDVCNSMGVVASLTMAGFGVSLLPLSAYGQEIESGKLRVLRTDPAVPSVEFSAVHPARQSALMKLLVELASEASSFERSAEEI
jgi:DNA-binding transcriptional LysR family regulator